jgi:hypothetical protein
MLTWWSGPSVSVIGRAVQNDENVLLFKSQADYDIA